MCVFGKEQTRRARRKNLICCQQGRCFAHAEGRLVKAFASGGRRVGRGAARKISGCKAPQWQVQAFAMCDQGWLMQFFVYRGKGGKCQRLIWILISAMQARNTEMGHDAPPDHTSSKVPIIGVKPPTIFASWKPSDTPV